MVFICKKQYCEHKFYFITVFFSISFMILTATTIVILIKCYYMFPNFNKVCPNEWIGYKNQCYYFSDNETNWYDSKKKCESMDSSLIKLDRQDVIDFVSKYGKTDYWIERKHYENIVSTSLYRNSFDMNDTSICLYFDLTVITETPCIFYEKWICVKPNNYVMWYYGNY
ncbi:C type lectin domain protein [Finch poxvirus]|uniref:C type lectin domain protein n=2 Tax=unclassified Avipoxvirus TaxID=336487 RepID=A0AAT9URE0_9POXV|nr:C type lectin domain protein [Finch poxvirus]UOX38898.1 C type lectin domain protein [Finch poxvirus]